MNKRFFRCLLLTFVCLAAPVLAQAYDFWVDGICYNILSFEDRTCEVTHNGSNSYQNFVDVPSTVDYNGRTYRVLGIGDRAFYGCRNLEDLTIAEGVTYIGANAFSQLRNITSLTLPTSLDSIASNAFSNNSDLTSLTLKGQSVVLDDYAFSSCTGLKTLSVKGNVRRIGEGCFDHCSLLAAMTIPSGVETIGENAFLCCYALTSFKVSADNAFFMAKGGVLFDKQQATLVAFPNGKEGSYVIPSGVTTIADGAFAGSKLLTKLTIPGSVSVIGFAAFNRCQSLTNIINLAVLPQEVRDDTFATYGKLHVLSSSKSAYRADEVWSRFTIMGDAVDTTPAAFAADDDIRITSHSGVLQVVGIPTGAILSVCDVQGKLLWQSAVQSGSAHVALPTGHVYIIKVQDKTFKFKI